MILVHTYTLVAFFFWWNIKRNERISKNKRQSDIKKAKGERVPDKSNNKKRKIIIYDPENHIVNNVKSK